MNTARTMRSCAPSAAELYKQRLAGYGAWCWENRIQPSPYFLSTEKVRDYAHDLAIIGSTHDEIVEVVRTLSQHAKRYGITVDIKAIMDEIAALRLCTV